MASYSFDQSRNTGGKLMSHYDITLYLLYMLILLLHTINMYLHENNVGE